MQRAIRRFCSLFGVALLLFTVGIPAYATETEYISKDTLWRWMAGNGGVVQKIVGYSFSSACSASDDGYHHASSYVSQGKLGHYACNCIYCGDTFTATERDLQQSYDAYVSDLPASGYTSDNGLIWRPTIEDVDRFYLGNSSISESKNNFTYDPSVPCIILPIQRYSGNPVNYENSLRIDLIAPISASYIPLNSLAFSYYAVHQSGATSTGEGYYNLSARHFVQGSTFNASMFFQVESYQYIRFQCFFPVYKLIPDVPLSGDTYNINTRPASITGGNYGIVGDNGQITKVEDNSTIINETNNTFYNPATGTTVPIVNWSYDYSDRSYKVTLESGDTATITYGDENITIQETTVTEGDTITNNYTIYYLVDGSGSVTPPCAHEWAETNTTPATCTVSGSKLLTCSKCQQTKTEPLPVLGHDWQVKQTVTTQYDDTGQLTQEGYTIFECSRCHEQYKSADGTIPPGGSGTDPGGDEDETLWDKLGKLLGTAVKGILDLLGSAVDVILGGLIDLVTNLFESLKQLVDLFGSVGEAFGVLWTWLPPEIMAILVAGVSIFVFVALLKLFMK